MNIKQSKLESTVEASLNTGSGFLFSLAVWIWIVPIIWPELDHTPLSTDIGLTVLFTVSSLLRSYWWRRFFANSIHKTIHNWISQSKLNIFRKNKK